MSKIFFDQIVIKECQMPNHTSVLSDQSRDLVRYMSFQERKIIYNPIIVHSEWMTIFTVVFSQIS